METPTHLLANSSPCSAALHNDSSRLRTFPKQSWLADLARFVNGRRFCSNSPTIYQLCFLLGLDISFYDLLWSFWSFLMFWCYCRIWQTSPLDPSIALAVWPGLPLCRLYAMYLGASLHLMILDAVSEMEGNCNAVTKCQKNTESKWTLNWFRIWDGVNIERSSSQRMGWTQEAFRFPCISTYSVPPDGGCLTVLIQHWLSKCTENKHAHECH